MVKLSEIELPVIFKNQLLFKAGNWNHISFSNEMVAKSVNNTKWSNLNKRLYLKHENAYDIEKWKGKVDNIKSVTKNGVAEVRGDIALWDANEAVQILHGEKPIALSADIEYSEDGTMFFTGFALEADPGVRDNEMFLSDAVKNELNGYYKASFSNQIDTEQIDNTVSTEPNPINTQSAERRLNENNQNMVDNTQTGNQQPVSGENKVSEVTENLVKELQGLRGDVQELKKVSESKPEVVQEVKSTPVPNNTNSNNEGTVIENKQLGMPEPKVETQMVDVKTVEAIIEKVAEKFKPEPSAMTVNEMAPIDNKTHDEKTVDRIVDYFEKTKHGQNNI